MSDQDIFAGDNAGAAQHQQAQGSTDNALELLVGEGRKYASAEDLAKAYMHADGFINQLKEEKAELERRGIAAQTIEDVVKRIKSEVAGTGNDQPPGASAGSKDSAPLDPKAIQDMVRAVVSDMGTEQQRAANRKKANDGMMEMFGDQAAAVLAREAPTAEAQQAMRQLAEAAPEKFLALFKSGAPISGGRIGSGSNVGQLAPVGLDREKIEGTKEYYNAIRKKDPRLYYSSKVQLEIQQAAARDPKKYFGR